jgi:RNA polymerase sigma factor (sigma-70 family)
MAEDVLLSFLSQRYDDLKHRLTRVLGNDDLAGDALHDTWLQLRRMEDSTTEILNPRAFLLRMAVNIAISSLRSQHRAVPQGELDELLEVADPAPGPQQAAEARAELEALSEIIERMPRRRREVLLLVRLEGMAQKDVAQRLGVSLSTVEQELKRAHLYCAERMAQRK